MGDVLAFAGLAHAVALDGLGQDHGRLPGVLHRRGVGGVDLVRVVAAAVQPPDVLVGQVATMLQQFRVLAEEVLAHVGAALGLVVLVLAVDGFFHALAAAGRSSSLASSGSQSLPQITLMTFQPAPRKTRFQLLDDLAVAAHRAVEALQVAVDDEDQVVELLARGQRDGAQRFRLVHLAVADESPDLAAVRCPRGRGSAGTS